jgi:signal transduction histidine kinase
VKFNRPDGRLRLALTVGENDVRLAVGNTGPGLSAEHRARIFERFFRGDAARSRAVAGFGLGLSISREIMLAHGGHLDLARSETDWTEFCAVLPRLAASTDQPRDDEGDTRGEPADEHRPQDAAAGVSAATATPRREHGAAEQ